MHKSRLGAIIIDCQTEDAEAAAAFWSVALGYEVRPTDDPRYVDLAVPEDQPQIGIQKVDHESRVHLDIETDDIPAEVARLEALGAKVARRLERWVVMEAPTGQRFCVVRIQRPGFPKSANRWD